MTDHKKTHQEVDAQMNPRIVVFGVGGAGTNAVNNMFSKLDVEFVVSNTDNQVLKLSPIPKKIQLGSKLTGGKGAGAKPDVGRAAAEEQIEEIRTYLSGCDMVFITAGMGGGTGTGAAPVIARTARDLGILTVGVVTKPFKFEGPHRMRTAESGIAEMQQYVDTLIVVPNENLLKVADAQTTFADAFKMADDVLYGGVRGVTDLILVPGLVNLDFADIRTVMSEMGKAMMGTGEAQGEGRAIAAAEAAISNPLLDEISLKGARALLINITGGTDIGLFEVNEAINRIRTEVDPDANIIFGTSLDSEMKGKLRISVVATGIEQKASQSSRVSPMAQFLDPSRKPSSSLTGSSTLGSKPMVRPGAANYLSHLVGSSASGAGIGSTARSQAAFAPSSQRSPVVPLSRTPETLVSAGISSEALRQESQTSVKETGTSAAALQKQTRPSFFARVTGFGQKTLRKHTINETQSEAKFVQEKAEESHVTPQPKDTYSAESVPQVTGAEEDVLDIPAFLRRQSN